MKILFATSNAVKVRNAQRALALFGIEVEQVEMDLIESRSDEPSVIAFEKAEQAYRMLKKPVMVEDSGFFIRALGGFPKTHVRFGLATVGIKGIIKLMRGVKERRCEWRMSVALARGPHDHRTFTFVEKGVIADSIRPWRKRKEGMSDLWQIYVPTMMAGNKHSLSEMPEPVRLKWQAFIAARNQFMMLGRAIKKR